jgi:hypothetical protein
MVPKVGVPVDNAEEIIGIAVGVVDADDDCLDVVVADRESIVDGRSNFRVISGAERIEDGCDLG